jgi:two-component system, NtrC family, response regulator AtoC
VPTPDELELSDTVLTTDAEHGVDEEEVRPGQLQVIVIGNGSFSTHPLPEAGLVTIGRSPTCDISVEDKSISRRHAILSIGDKLTIEDLSSANGTRVRGLQLKLGHPTRISVGELVGLGKINIILQQRSAPRSRKVLTREDFGSRLEEECLRTQRSGAAFALLRIEPEVRGSASLVEEALCEMLRETDILGRHAPHEFRVLLIDTPPSNADDAVRRISGKLLQRGHKIRILVACYPRDGGTAQQLLMRVHPPSTPSATSEKRARVNGAGIVVSDPQMLSLHQLIEQVAGSQLGVLLLGETGVGKEVFARAVHRASNRSAGPFVELNCAALTETLLESELFGHEKGAFTHATSAKLGLIETADNGTLFLDEIGDMPLSTQAKLLRVIEDAQLRRVGGLKSRTIDVRFVAATNIDLEARIEAGTFRRDLYYRLNGVTLMIPPLRERLTELEPLASLFVEQTWHRSGPPPKLADDTLDLLMSYRWPGNIRELKYMIQRAVLVCGNGPIMPEHLPDKVRALVSAITTPPPSTEFEPGPTGEPPTNVEAQAYPSRPSGESEHEIIDALNRTNGNQTAAARLLGISRRTLVNRLNAYKDIERPRKGKRPPH